MSMRGVANRLRDWLAVRTFDPRDTAGTERLLWSKGYARHCDFGGPAGYWLADTESVQPADMFRDVYPEAHGLVWVRLGTGSRDGRTADLDLFVRHALPAIRRPFILLTGDGDVSVPSELDPRTVEALVGSRWLVAWYTQNHDGTGGERFGPLPIGLDLHTPSPFSSPSRRADTLSAIAAGRVPARRQPLNVFCDIGLSPASQDRRDAVATLAGCAHMVMQRRRVSRAAIWRRYAGHPFVLSARGYGLDCHRTWEALYLGSIVITPASSLDPLYEGLPVVTVRTWDEVLSRDNLRRWLDRCADLASPERIARLLDARTRLAKFRDRLA
jgi:hypothetical protein